ncbi:TIGR02530 family flagellar biosynthesis protein [Paraconexibacter algicola]|uniref:Flagellar biosynthesis protein n=1 Tax=Paraconexibacter algicola TaxID=2133960 RepID=A0A2T4UIZ2_9ACTN|nr:TIGR02530 family flagellar biosynthesis protein [Paraconexibacter algicola]PTL59167.1 flagellar biosynthesis protein [Paraconexibacter algicola]
MSVLPNPALVPPGVSGPVGPPPTQPARTQQTSGPAFSELLAHRSHGVQFSNHALQRLGRRGIEVDQATLQRLDDGVTRAAGKGARETVVLVDQSAFVVSVRNRTVITAIDREQMRDHVFTNIDSAVIA